MSAEGRVPAQEVQHFLLAWAAAVGATIPLFAVLHGREWFVRAMLITAAVALLGLLGRLARIPAPIAILVQLGVAAGYLVTVYAPDDLRYGFVPTRDSWHQIWDVGNDGYDQLRTVSPSTKDLAGKPGVVLILLGIVALMAVFINALAISYRQPALAGAPMLTVYVIAASVHSRGLDWWMFLPPALTYLLLLAVDSQSRLLAWGVPIGGRSQAAGARRGGSELSRMLRRIGFSVLSFALIVPLLLPKLTHGRVGTDGPDDDTTGKTISTLNPLVTMRRDLVRPANVDLLTMRTTSEHPSEEYLRTVTLDEFTGDAWIAGKREVSQFDHLPDVAGLSPSVVTSPVLTQVTAAPALQSDYLPMTFPATKVDVAGEWRLDEKTVNLVSHKGRKQISGTHWTVQSLDIAPTEKDVVDASPAGDYLQQYLKLPDNIPAVVKDMALRVTKGAANPLEIAAALQGWFRNPANFTYDLRSNFGSGSNDLVAFLRDRRGYCEQFAATMAVMARQLGVPARVDVGFTAGKLSDDGLSRTISAYDAHAWPELWIPNLGWTRFEPTPGSANSNPSAPSWLPRLGKGVQDPDNNDRKNDDQPTSKPEDAAGAGGDNGDGDGGGQQAAPTPVGCDPGTHFNKSTEGCDPNPDVWWKRWWKWELGGLGLLLLLAAPALIRELIRRRRWLIAGRTQSGSEVAEIAWRELGDDAVDLGLAWPDSRTPRRTLAEVGADAKLTAEGLAALNLLSAAVERSRYAREALGPVDANRMRTAVLVVATQLGVRAGRWRRIVARVAPASVWFTVRNGMHKVGRAASARSARLRPRGAKA
jgi:transglutaminase-like putative cysteine protease